MQRSFKAARKVLGQAIAQGRALLLQLLRPALALVALTLVLVAMLLQLMLLATVLPVLSIGGFALRATTRSS